MTLPEERVAEIARAMTKAQRADLVAGRNAHLTAFLNLGLTKVSCVSSKFEHGALYELTPLGRAVAAHLEAMKK